MFHLVDDALEALLREDEPALAEIAISFADLVDPAAPTTLQVRLWRVNLSARGAASGTEVVQRDGGKVRRHRLPSVELSYAVSAHASDPREEHRILAAALRTFLRNASVPQAQVPEPLREQGATVSLRVPKVDADDGPGPFDRRAVVDLRVSVPIDLEREQVLAAAPGSTDLALADQRSGAHSSRQRFAGEVKDPAAVGVDVLGPAGAATVDEEGRFVIVASPGDRLAVMLDPPVTVVVPESGRIVVG